MSFNREKAYSLNCRCGFVSSDGSDLFSSVLASPVPDFISSVSASSSPLSSSWVESPVTSRSVFPESVSIPRFAIGSEPQKTIAAPVESPSKSRTSVQDKL